MSYEMSRHWERLGRNRLFGFVDFRGRTYRLHWSIVILEHFNGKVGIYGDGSKPTSTIILAGVIIHQSTILGYRWCQRFDSYVCIYICIYIYGGFLE